MPPSSDVGRKRHEHARCEKRRERRQARYDQLRGYLVDDDIVYGATQIFDALSDSTRFQILGVLVQGERSVSDLQEVGKVSQSAISHQLRLLRDRGLVTARREGQRVFYSLSDEHVADLISIGLSHAAELVTSQKD